MVSLYVHVYGVGFCFYHRMNQRKFLGKQLSEDIKKKEKMNQFLVVHELVYNVEITRTLKNTLLNCEHLVDVVKSPLSVCSPSDRSLLLLSEHCICYYSAVNVDSKSHSCLYSNFLDASYTLSRCNPQLHCMAS